MSKNIKRIIHNLKKNAFLFEQLVRRDFQHKYKGTILGMLWSVLNPLFTLLIMRIIFYNFFGRTMPHYTIYLFAGNIVMAYYKEATNQGMQSLLANRAVIQKINVPKYLFLFSANVSSLVNFLITFAVFLIFCILDKITFTPLMFTLVFPILCLIILNVGVGMILSALIIFFRDMSYLYSVFLTLLTYVSAIFYTIDDFPEKIQRLFLLNPVYVIIKYFRVVVIDGTLPSLSYHLLMLFYAFLFFVIGSVMYKKFNHKFTYFM